MLKHLRTHMRWIMITIALAFLLSTFLMYDSRSSRSSRRGVPPPSEDGRIEDYAVAVINGNELKRSELERMVINYVQQSNMRELTSTDFPYLFQTTLDNAVFQTELNKEAEARKFDASEEEITAHVRALSDSYPTREAYYQALERSGVKMADLRNDFRRQIIVEKTIESAIGEHTISDDAILDFYNMMKGLLYSKPKGFTFDLIEVSVDKTANELQERIAANVENWKAIISEDEYSPDILRITDEPLFFSEMAISNDKDLYFMKDMKIGEVGRVTEVRSDDFMIPIKREDREESFTPFEETSSDIRSMLLQQHQRIAYEQFRNELISRAVVEILDPSLFPAPASPDVESSLEPEGIEATSTEQEAKEDIGASSMDQEAKEEVEAAPTDQEITEKIEASSTEQEAKEEVEATPTDQEITEKIEASSTEQETTEELTDIQEDSVPLAILEDEDMDSDKDSAQVDFPVELSTNPDNQEPDEEIEAVLTEQEITEKIEASSTEQEAIEELTDIQEDSVPLAILEDEDMDSDKDSTPVDFPVELSANPDNQEPDEETNP